MRRNFPQLGSTTFDVAIVGGGITGSCIARDAARRGLSVALIEKRDFSCGTSSGSSKLVHGGLRYLKSLEFGLIRESLRERRVWEKIAPHMVYPLLFMVPVHSTSEKWVVGTGLTLYDLLSFDRNRLDDPDQHMASHWSISKAEALAMEPSLEGKGLAGALLYYDCQMHSPERLGLECLIDAVAHGAVIANYAEAVSFEKGADGVGGIRVRDAFDGGEVTLKSKVVVNAAGPWADSMLEMIQGGEASHKLIRSKGIHIVTDARTKGHALTVSNKGGHFFVLPWREHTIFGTTDSVFTGKPDELHVTPEDIDGFIAFMKKGLPGLKISRDDVRYAYAGLRPLVDDGSKNSYNTSRKAEIVDHGAEGGPGNLLSAIGGKWTTSRDIGEKCVDLIARKLGSNGKACDTAEAPLPGATGRFKTFVEREQGKHKDKAPSIVANLARNYGARASEVLDVANSDARLLRPISQRLPDIAAQIIFAVRSEMAFTLDDVLFRRTGLGTLGPLEANAVEDAAQIMAGELGWSEAERRRQIEFDRLAVQTFGARMMKTLAVINPRSAGGKTGRDAETIARRLAEVTGPLTVALTSAPMEAVRITSDALRDGYGRVVAVGGDGTINEVVNGFFSNGVAINPEAEFALLNTGTGGDFRKTFDIAAGFDASLERIAEGHVRRIDVGRLTYVTDDGKSGDRHFANIASFGMSGDVMHRVNRATLIKRFTGRFAFTWGSLVSMVRYKARPVRLKVDNVFDGVISISTCAVCNGQFFGGGMRVAPDASPDDGLLDVIVIGDAPKREIMKSMNAIYTGTHVNSPHVKVFRGKSVIATPVEATGGAPVYIEVDGETPGQLPAMFEVMPKALKFRA